MESLIFPRMHNLILLINSFLQKFYVRQKKRTVPKKNSFKKKINVRQKKEQFLKNSFKKKINVRHFILFKGLYRLMYIVSHH